MKKTGYEIIKIIVNYIRNKFSKDIGSKMFPFSDAYKEDKYYAYLLDEKNKEK